MTSSGFCNLIVFRAFSPDIMLLSSREITVQSADRSKLQVSGRGRSLYADDDGVDVEVQRIMRFVNLILHSRFYSWKIWIK